MDLTRPSSDGELRAWAARLRVRLDGVAKRDDAPRVFRPGASWILNLSDLQRDGGTHWCAVYKMPRQQGSDDVVVMDSYGMPPPEDWLASARRDHDRVYHNTVQLQAMDSQACGYFALAFIWWAQRHMHFDAPRLLQSFQALFREPGQNDALLKRLLLNAT